jgi:hypothetical protein
MGTIRRGIWQHVLAVGVALIFAAAAGAQSDVFLYPKKGQSAEQQQTDKMECASWANQQTGFNPTTPAPTPDQFASGQPVTQGGAVKGAARGAAVGARRSRPIRPLSPSTTSNALRTSAPGPPASRAATTP